MLFRRAQRSRVGAKGSPTWLPSANNKLCTDPLQVCGKRKHARMIRATAQCGAKGSPLRARQRPHTQARPVPPKVVDALLLVAGRVSLREPTIQHQRGKGCHHMLEIGLELVAGRALV